MANKRAKRRVLFLCTHNSSRSQMAEGLLRHLYGDAFEAHSAGTAPSSVNPYAIRVMAEAGVDISGHRSKHLNEFQGQTFDYVITVCDPAREQCPYFPGAVHSLHWSLPDPSQVQGSEEERLAVFRQVREDIRRRIEETFKEGRKGHRPEREEDA